MFNDNMLRIVSFSWPLFTISCFDPSTFFRHYICVHSLLSLFLHFFFLSHCAAAFLAPSVSCFDPGFQWAQTVSNLLHAPPIECLLLVFFFSLNFVPLFFLTNFCAAILYVMYEIIFLVWDKFTSKFIFFLCIPPSYVAPMWFRVSTLSLVFLRILCHPEAGNPYAFNFFQHVCFQWIQ